MTATQIIIGLERLDLTGSDADAAARMGFLEWVFSQPDAATPEQAIAALKAPEARHAESPSAQAFVGFLRDATHRVMPRRRRGRVTRWH